MAKAKTARVKCNAYCCHGRQCYLCRLFCEKLKRQAAAGTPAGADTEESDVR